MRNNSNVYYRKGGTVMSKFKERLILVYLTTAAGLFTAGGIRAIMESFKEDK